jgi:hypothetical protein
MSIRRKTCETTSLLYEAALKTNLSEQQDRPSDVNPTAGVKMREQFGNSVFIPDTTKPGGGIWVAGSRDEMLNSGLPQGDQILESDYSTRSVGQGQEKVATVLDHTAHDIPAGFRRDNRNDLESDNNINNDQYFMQGMQNATNVNPNINDMGIPIDPNVPMMNGGEQLAGQDVCSPFSLI